jgi:hypothetical protein
MGIPAPFCIATSIDSLEHSLRSYMQSACAMYGTSRRLTMKPGVSLHCTGWRLTCVANSMATSMVADDVFLACTTSHRFISCTGLLRRRAVSGRGPGQSQGEPTYKKCRPTTLSGRPDATAMCSIGNDDVLLARIVFLLHTWPSCV